MSNRAVLEFDSARCPTTNDGSLLMFAQGIAEYLRTRDPSYLPPGVEVVTRRRKAVRKVSVRTHKPLWPYHLAAPSDGD